MMFLHIFVRYALEFSHTMHNFVSACELALSSDFYLALARYRNGLGHPAVRLSDRPSVRHTLFAPFPSSDLRETFREY